ncbi:hypothetical protein DdX_01940 [Ditylenchus destructor]|uniref:Uncharacterized protein n=1 Tax=Ditylenchus destructor TaxID=166010 RepID=A0AAD4NGP7_9BILA|nr:hypothetical protein DdX_01940 [Ditylenchus destructor]
MLAFQSILKGHSPYVSLISVTAFYASTETQLQVLYCIVASVICIDLLFSSTRDHSVIYECFTWPTRDFFKTLSVALCSYAIYALKNEEKERAFASSLAAVSCLVVNPVYKYQKVNDKIKATLAICLESLREFIISYIAVPLIWLHNWVSYIFLCRWIPGLVEYLRSCWHALGARMSSVIVRMRAVYAKIMDVMKYWICFHWWTDLRQFLKLYAIDPAVSKLSELFKSYISEPIKAFCRGFVYVVGCYWIVPLSKKFGNLCLSLCGKCVNLQKRGAIAFGSYVLRPLLGAFYDRLCDLGLEAYNWFYMAAIQPTIDICYAKYKFLEDLIFIHILGPIFAVLLSVVPNKNPFAETVDHGLDEFLPDITESDAESNVTKDSHASKDEDPTGMSFDESSGDERKFLPKGLSRIEIGSDSSDAESLYPLSREHKAKRKRYAQNAT